jgi:hypothetical protein
MVDQRVGRLLVRGLGRWRLFHLGGLRLGLGRILGDGRQRRGERQDDQAEDYGQSSKLVGHGEISIYLGLEVEKERNRRAKSGMHKPALLRLSR